MDARVQNGVGQVNDKVDHDVANGDDDNEALDDGVVAGGDGSG